MSDGNAKWQTFFCNLPVCFRIARCSPSKKCFTSTKGPNSIMAANPAIGVVYHWLGGLASGSFYVPYKGVKRWAWETYWLTGGFFSWIIAPWALGLLMTNDLVMVLREAPGRTIFWCYFFGMLWGTGGLRFDHAIPRDVARHGDGAGLLRRVRNADAPDIQWPVLHHGDRNTVGARCPDRHRRLPDWDRCSGRGGRIEGTGNVGGAEEGGDQGIQSPEGNSCGHFLWSDECMLFLWSGRRSDQTIDA